MQKKKITVTTKREADIPMILFSKFKMVCGSKPKLFKETF